MHVAHAFYDGLPDPLHGGEAEGAEEAVRHLHYDALLCCYLREQGFQGPHWDRYVHQLLGYGLAAITALIRSGIIFAESASIGRSVGDSPANLCRQDIEDMVAEVVLKGFELFLVRGLIKGEWSPAGGRTLNQYFRNACVREFPNVFRKWKRASTQWNDVYLLNDLSVIDPSSVVIATPSTVEDRLAELADLLSDEELAIFAMCCDGYRYDEIGKRLNRSAKWVEKRVAQARKKIRDFRAGGREERS